MAQKYGAGTVFTGGPGTNFRGPLFVTPGPTALSPTPSGDNQTWNQIFDANGNLIQASSGSIYKEALITIPNASVLTLHSVPVSLVAAPGAGLIIDVDSVVMNLVYATATFTLGGVIGCFYGATAVAATNTIAASFLVGPTVNQIAKLDGHTGLANIASSGALNTALYLSAATQDFGAGGGSLVVLVSYRVMANMA